MRLKDIRNRINRKIDENYKARQKVLGRIRESLDIDFNKIAIYRREINIGHPKDDHEGSPGKEGNKDSALLKIELPTSFIGKARYYYKGIDIDSLTLEEANNLESNLEYILEEIEKNMDRIIPKEQFNKEQMKLDR
jgi:hypothetical protein